MKTIFKEMLKSKNEINHVYVNDEFFRIEKAVQESRTFYYILDEVLFVEYKFSLGTVIPPDNFTIKTPNNLLITQDRIVNLSSIKQDIPHGMNEEEWFQLSTLYKLFDYELYLELQKEKDYILSFCRGTRSFSFPDLKMLKVCTKNIDNLRVI